MRRKHTIDQQESEVDMTPMLDIVFIMLIFFIVTTSFIKESGIEINRPTESKSPIPPTNSIVIKINELEDVHFNGRLVSHDSIQANVEAALSKAPKAAVSVQVAESADTGVLVDIVDQVKRAGIKQVTVSQLVI